jgi:hypothetical protein
MAMAAEQKLPAMSKSRRWLTIGWVVVFLHAIALAYEYSRPGYPNRYRYAGIYFLLLAGVGTWRRWGTTVLFGLGVFCVVAYWQPYPHVGSTHMDEVMVELGIPIIWAAFGTIIGLMTEFLPVLLEIPPHK